MDIVTDFGTRRKCDAIDADEIGHAVQIRLRLRAQFIVHRDEHVLAAEQIEPRLEMRRVTIATAEIGARLQHLVERTARPREMKNQLVRRERMIDGIAQRGDDAAIRNVSLDAAGRERMKKIRTDLRDFASASRVAKMIRVPVDALVVERVEELSLLHTVGQIDAALEHAMQPGGAGAAGAGADDLWQRSSAAQFRERRRRGSFGVALTARLLPRGEIDLHEFLERLDFGEVELAQARVLLGR